MVGLPGGCVAALDSAHRPSLGVRGVVAPLSPELEELPRYIRDMESATLVLVHSPLVGPMSWEPVADEMRARGRQVVVPSLTGTAVPVSRQYEAMADIVRDAYRRAGAAERVVVVVHSGAGPLVPAIVDRMIDHMEGVVFVDATLPHPGRAWFDNAPPEMSEQLRCLADAEGLLPPWHEWFAPEAVRELVPDAATRTRFVAEIPRLSLGYFAEVAPASDTWTTLPCAFLQLSAGYDGAAAEARSRGWTVDHHDGHHLSAVTEPRLIADALRSLADRL